MIKSELTQEQLEFGAQGGPIYFDIPQFLTVIDQFVASDEVITALNMLKNVPGYYRDNPHPLIEAKRKQILSSVATLIDYQNCEVEFYDQSLAHEKTMHNGLDSLDDFMDLPFCQPRAMVLCAAVKAYNDQGLIPHIVELGPANYWVPYGLMNKQFKFTYRPITLNPNALINHMSALDRPNHLMDVLVSKEFQPTIFICFEVIEHMWDHNDLAHYYHREKVDADRIIISTPLYTLLGGNHPDKPRMIEHLRTYGPTELFRFASGIFPNYNWTNYVSGLQVIEGIKK